MFMSQFTIANISHPQVGSAVGILDAMTQIEVFTMKTYFLKQCNIGSIIFLGLSDFMRLWTSNNSKVHFIF